MREETYEEIRGDSHWEECEEAHRERGHCCGNTQPRVHTWKKALQSEGALAFRQTQTGASTPLNDCCLWTDTKMHKGVEKT